MLGVTESVPVSKYKLLKHVVENISAQNVTHFYCKSCSAYVDPASTSCDMCGDTFSKDEALRAGCFFVYLPIGDQMKDLLQSGYVEEHMLKESDELGRVGHNLNGMRYRRNPSLDTLTINWNFDGLPIFKSSGASLWPILAQINELRPDAKKEQILLCGVWFGTKKPNWLSFSKPFVDELRVLGTEGIFWYRGDRPMVTKVLTHAIICDAPARCMVQGVHQFNGSFGCTWCLQEGRVVQKGNGHARVYEHEADVPQRTHDSVIDSAHIVMRDDVDHHNGVKLASPLLGLPASCGVDIVESFSVDYMHAVLLGIVRQMLELWFGSKWSGAVFSIRGSLHVVDAKLLSIMPPQDLSRTPRTLRDFNHWKASECRNWLLYYSVPCLNGSMRTKYLQHWCLLVNALYALLQDTVIVEDLYYAERALRSFSGGMEELYGKENMTSNVHASLHLADCVRNLGPLWSCSAFPFEGYMMNLKRFIKGTTRVPQQVASTYLMSQMVRKHLKNPSCDESVSALAQKWLNVHAPGDRVIRTDDGAVGLNVTETRPLAPAERRLLTANGYDVPDDGLGRYVRRAIIRGSVISTRLSGRKQKRNNYTLFTQYGVGRVESICFAEVNGGIKCFLFLKKSTSTAPLMSLKHVWIVNHTDSLMLCRPSEIHGNAVVVNVPYNGEDVCVCARQPNCVEKD